MRRLAMFAVVSTILVSSCSSDETTSSTTPTVPVTESESDSVPDPVVTEAPAPAESEPAATEAVESVVPTSVPAAVTEDDLALFIAATERALVGTDQESAVFDDPEIYIALGQAACARFSADETFEQIATDLLNDIDTENAADETRLVGAVIGAATQTLCPEHADKI